MSLVQSKIQQEYPNRDCHILSKKVIVRPKAESFSWYTLDSR